MITISTRQKLFVFFYSTFTWNLVREALLVDGRTRLLAKRRTLNQSQITSFLEGREDADGSKKSMRCGQSRDTYEPYVGIPKLALVAQFYMILSTCWHIANIAMNLYLKYYGEENFETGNTYICYVPRFVFHEGLEQSYMVWLSVVVSIIHLTWRIMVVVFERSFTLDMLPYLSWNDELIREGSDSSKALNDYNSRAGLDLVQNVIFYRSFDATTNNPALRVRPNRTPEARRRLYAFINQFSIVSAVIVATATLLIMSIVLRTILLKQNDLYQGCEVVFFDRAYLIRFFFSWTNTSILFIDNALIIYLQPGLVVILIYDLYLYWKSIEARLIRLRNLLPIARAISDQCQSHMMTKIRNSGQMDNGSRYLRRMSLSGVLNFGQLDIEREITELRWVMVDFFKQVSQVDRFVSTVVGLAIVTWLLANAMVTMTGLQLHTQYLTVIIVRSFQIAGLFALTVMSLIFFVIKQVSEDAYLIISTLMAFDPSINKKRWIVLLEYYTFKPRYAITVYRTHKIYDHLTYLKVVSYTLSFFFFVESYRQ